MIDFKVVLNTWGAYSYGQTDYGWMTIKEARKFIEDNPSRDGGEWYIVDIDDCNLGIRPISIWGNLDYANVIDVLNDLELLQDLDTNDILIVLAIVDCHNDTIKEAIDQKDNYTWFANRDSWEDFIKESVTLEAIDYNIPKKFIEYFNFDRYLDELEMDTEEAMNGVIIYEQ